MVSACSENTEIVPAYADDFCKKIHGNDSSTLSRELQSVHDSMLHKTGEGLMPGLRELELNAIHMTGRPLHPRDVLAHLERLRDVSGGRIGYLVW